MAWKLKGPLSGCRSEFQLSTRLVHARQSIRAPARAQGRLCIAHNRTAAMLAWKLKWHLRGCRLDLQLYMRPLHDRVSMSAVCEAPARARSRVCSAHKLGQFRCRPGNSSGTLAVADGISSLLCGLYMLAYFFVQPAKRRRALACGRPCIVHNRTAAMLA